MFILEADSAAQYLIDQGVIKSSAEVDVCVLTGGVSNRVLQVCFHDRQRENWVVKQAREQLAVEQLWRCSVKRVLREMDVLGICNQILEHVNSDSAYQAQVPAILFEDRDNFVFAMTAMQGGSHEWKQDLLQGKIDSGVAQACGWLLATLHSGTWHDEAIAEEIGNTDFFDQLRLDPYYRQIARVHRRLEPDIRQLLADLAGHRQCLVHGDYSPKNILVDEKRLMLLDFEVGHFGDPAFDLGFFLAHLVIKSIWDCQRTQDYCDLVRSFCNTYLTIMQSVVSVSELAAVEQRACRNLGACLVARVDGKSPVEYLEKEHDKQTVRQLGCRLLTEPPTKLELVWTVVADEINPAK